METAGSFGENGCDLTSTSVSDVGSGRALAVAVRIH